MGGTRPTSSFPQCLSQDVWALVDASLKSALHALEKIIDDPTAWEHWCRTGGGTAGERLLQLLQAMFGLTASATGLDVSQIRDRGNCTAIARSIHSSVAAAYQAYAMSLAWRQLSSWLHSPRTRASILHAGPVLHGISCAHHACCLASGQGLVCVDAHISLSLSLDSLYFSVHLTTLLHRSGQPAAMREVTNSLSAAVKAVQGLLSESLRMISEFETGRIGVTAKSDELRVASFKMVLRSLNLLPAISEIPAALQGLYPNIFDLFPLMVGVLRLARELGPLLLRPGGMPTWPKEFPSLITRTSQLITELPRNVLEPLWGKQTMNVFHLISFILADIEIQSGSSQSSLPLLESFVGCLGAGSYLLEKTGGRV